MEKLSNKELEEIMNPVLDLMKKMEWQLAVSDDGEYVHGFIIGEESYVNGLLNSNKQ